MARGINHDAYSAFINRTKFTSSNTRVEVKGGDVYMYLFDNCIAKTEGSNILINHCGYTTNTTRDRLSLFDVTIRKYKSDFIINESFVWKEGWLNLNKLR